MHAHFLSRLRYHPSELVSGDETSPLTVKWDILRESFLLTFIFEDGFESIDEVLKEIK